MEHVSRCLEQSAEPLPPRFATGLGEKQLPSGHAGPASLQAQCK